MALFQPGAPGRPPGAINKRSKDFMAILEKNGFCPASAMMDIFKVSMQKFAEDLEKENDGRISPMESNAAKYLKIAADMTSDLATYAYPKLKAIEHAKLNVAENMSPEQRLEAMKHAVQMLELQVKQKNGP